MKSQTSVIKYLVVAPAWLALFTLNLQLSTAFAQAGGSLAPPLSAFNAGAPQPTMTTLLNIEPRTPISSLPYPITQPGSYYLTTNLTGVSGQDGITISANDVTLDLMGFTLLGGGGLNYNGINVVSGGNNLAIRNGVLDSWGLFGVIANNASHSQFERLRVTASGQIGISVGNYCTVKDCTANANSNDGLIGYLEGSIRTADNCTVKDCTANANGGDGIVTGDNCIVIGCTANGSLYFDGIDVGNYCTVIGCTASNNNGSGISINGTNNRIDGNKADNNAYYGIVPNSESSNPVNVGNIITRNSASGNDYGNYLFSPGNDYAPVQTPSTATSPWANF